LLFIEEELLKVLFDADVVLRHDLAVLIRNVLLLGDDVVEVWGVRVVRPRSVLLAVFYALGVADGYWLPLLYGAL
jgi:hypothetical protein